MYWKINRIQFPVYNLGPGKRLAIWVQGCSLACKGCINPELWTENGGKNVEIASLASSILKIKDHFDGITITGGEPFEQYNAVVAFGSFIKMKSNLNLLVYSGFTLEELEQRFRDKLFMNSLDYLIDGRFERDFAVSDNIRGSSNQNFYTFEGGKNVKDNNQFFNGKWSLNVTKGNQIFMAGVPKKDDMSSLIGYLKDSGIKLDL